jgi:class 3 adenylate cyclase
MVSESRWRARPGRACAGKPLRQAGGPQQDLQHDDMITITTFNWVPRFVRGLVRDPRVCWALQQVNTPGYRALQPFGQIPVWSGRANARIFLGMSALRTTVLMKTDIAGSTPRFRRLLTADLQALLVDHRNIVARHAADHGGEIVKFAGDGYWLQFPSVTGAAKSAIDMQDALRAAQVNKGDNRIAMRNVIGLGDVAFHQGNLIADLLALMVRIEDITPPDEIYLTVAARLALVSAEIQTGLVDSFTLQGFAEPVPVYRIEQRHRTNIVANAYVLVSDIRGFARLSESMASPAVERLLDALDGIIRKAARDLGGTIHFGFGDSYCLTFPDTAMLMAAAEQLACEWEMIRRDECADHAITISLHRGKISMFRSFLYGEGFRIASRMPRALAEVLQHNEGGVFVTGPLRDDLYGSSWHNRLQPLTLDPGSAHSIGLNIYRLLRAEEQKAGGL